MKKVMIGGNGDNESTILSAFTETMNTGVDVTSIRDKFLSMVGHTRQFYTALSTLGRCNKLQDVEVFAGYAISEVDKYQWNEKYDVKYLMQNFQNKTVIADCKAALNGLINSDWVSYAIAFFETAQAWKNDFFTESTDPERRHMQILTPIARPIEARVEVATRLFIKAEVQLLFTRNVKFSPETEIDLFHELAAMRKLDWRDVLLVMRHGEVNVAGVNTNYISMSNLMLYANDIINDIYTPDINCDVVRDFVEQGIGKLLEGTGKRFNPAKKFVARKTDMFRENFHKYYRAYVRDGSMLTFMMGFIEDINESMENESDSESIMKNIDGFQKMILTKINNDGVFGQHRGLINKLMERSDRESLVRNTQDMLSKIRSGANKKADGDA